MGQAKTYLSPQDIDKIKINCTIFNAPNKPYERRNVATIQFFYYYAYKNVFY